MEAKPREIYQWENPRVRFHYYYSFKIYFGTILDFIMIQVDTSTSQEYRKISKVKATWTLYSRLLKKRILYVTKENILQSQTFKPTLLFWGFHWKCLA